MSSIQRMFSSFSCVLGVLLWWFLSSVVRLLAAAGDFFWSERMIQVNLPRITLRTAVDQFCSQCRGHDAFAVGNCPRFSCPLHPVRPNQSLEGSTPMDYNDEDVQQEVADALDYDDLKGQIG
jgi:hypothetical protein